MSGPRTPRTPKKFFSPHQLAMRGLTYPTPNRSVEYKDQWTGRPIDDHMTPRGLQNQSVNCYRNSAWQAMMSIPAFCSWLQRNHGPNRSGKGSKCSMRDCSGCQMYKVFNEIYPEKGRAAHSPELQLRILESVDNFFSETDLDTEQKWRKTWLPNGSIRGDRDGQEDAAEYLSFMQEAVGKRVMHRARVEFKGMFEMKSKVTCECRLLLNEYDRYPPSVIEESIIPVNLPNNGARWTVEDHFAEMYNKCPFCGRLSGDGIERYRISDAPKAIFIQINSSGGYSKRTEDIEFPDNLELTPYFNPELSEEIGPHDMDALYRLSSIIWHAGSGNAGHVTAVVRDPTTAWTYLDDHRAETYDTIEEFLVTRMGKTQGAGWNVGVLTYVKAQDASPQPNWGGHGPDSRFHAAEGGYQGPTVESDEDERMPGAYPFSPKYTGRESKGYIGRRREIRRVQEEARLREEAFQEEARKTEEARIWQQRQEQLRNSKKHEEEQQEAHIWQQREEQLRRSKKREEEQQQQQQGNDWRNSFLGNQQPFSNQGRKPRDLGFKSQLENEQLNLVNQDYGPYFNPRKPEYSQDDSYKYRKFSLGQGLYTTSPTNARESPAKIAEFDRETRRLVDEAAERGEPSDTTQAKITAWREDRHWQNVRLENLKRRTEEQRREKMRERREQYNAERAAASPQGDAEPSSVTGKKPTSGAGHKPNLYTPGGVFRESPYHPYPSGIRKPPAPRKPIKWIDVTKKSRFLGRDRG